MSNLINHIKEVAILNFKNVTKNSFNIKKTHDEYSYKFYILTSSK